jgi:uncharacterized membrane protein
MEAGGAMDNRLDDPVDSPASDPSGGAAGETLVKDWLLKRNCAVTPRQFVGFYLFLSCVSFTIAAIVALTGAWMVLIFTALEVLVVGTAFVIYARHAVDYEHIRLEPHRLVVEQMCASRMTHYEFNPRWVRVEVGFDASARPGVPWTAARHARITLHAAGRAVEIGQHLALEQRARFAQDLRRWIRRCA